MQSHLNPERQSPNVAMVSSPRGRALQPAPMPGARLRLAVAEQCLWHGERQIKLTPREFTMLEYLVDRPGELLSKAQLMDAVWPGLVVEDGQVKQFVSRLRALLHDRAEEPRFIETVRARGYRYLGGIEIDALAEASAQRAGQFHVRCSALLVDEPFGALLDALDAVCAAPEGGAARTAMLRHAPDWALQLPWRFDHEELLHLRQICGECSEGRMRREFAHWLGEMRTERGWRLRIDDLNAADPATQRLVAYLASRAACAEALEVRGVAGAP